MGEEDMYRRWVDSYKYSNIWSNYLTLNSYTGDSDDIFGDLYSSPNPTRTCSEKLDKILLDVLTDFSSSPLKIIYNTTPRTIKYKIVIENSDKRTYIEYGLETHKFSGLLEMSLGKRNLMGITDEEVEKIQKSLLIWIYENV